VSKEVGGVAHRGALASMRQRMGGGTTTLIGEELRMVADDNGMKLL
jgi:hypothetical protein